MKLQNTHEKGSTGGCLKIRYQAREFWARGKITKMKYSLKSFAAKAPIDIPCTFKKRKDQVLPRSKP
jgi:hypothetical protein